MPRPEKFVPLPYREQSTGKLLGVQKFFEDPDYVHMRVRDNNCSFDLAWATNKTAIESLDALGEFVQSNRLTTGSLALRHTFRRPGYIIGGVNSLEGDIEDVINEIRDSPDRTANFSLSGPDFELWWHRSWGVDFHNIPINEILLRFEREQSISRFAIDHCMSLTALDGLKNSIDVTLDEFAEYEPNLSM